MKTKLTRLKEDHKIIFYLLVTFLVLLNLFMLMQVMPIFTPVLYGLQIVLAPIVASVIAYYIFNPFVDYLENKGLPRLASVIIVFVAIILLITIGILFIVPLINDQINAIVQEFPAYWEQGVAFFEEQVGEDRLPQMLESLFQSNLLQNATGQIQTVLSATIGGIGSVINVTAQIVITIFTVPFVLYFLLMDSGQISDKLILFTPTRFRPTARRFIANVNNQLGIYVRGQIFVAICVAIIFLIGYAGIGLNYYLVLAVIAGFFNFVPYLGSFLSGVLAVVVALFQDPILLVYLVVVFAVEQILENRVIQPLVLGSQLNIHPITILFILLISGSLFGVVGLLLGVPGYAILKIIFSMLFEYIDDHTDLYHEDDFVEAEDAVLQDEESQ